MAFGRRRFVQVLSVQVQMLALLLLLLLLLTVVVAMVAERKGAVMTV